LGILIHDRFYQLMTETGRITRRKAGFLMPDRCPTRFSLPNRVIVADLGWSAGQPQAGVVSRGIRDQHADK
jgi:hypothetical protein